MLRVLALFLVSLMLTNASANDTLQQSWSEEQLDEILAKTLRLHLSPDMSALSPAEVAAVAKLIEVGAIFQDLYEYARHPQSRDARAMLDSLDESEHARKLRDVFRLMRGPITTTLENSRENFLPVAAESKRKNVYPPGMDKATLNAFLDDNPELRAKLLHVRSVVRGADSARADLAVLEANPTLDMLHPGLRDRLSAIAADPSVGRYYALPYSVAYADELNRAFVLLNEAADLVAEEDDAFARFLRLRARDLLADDYDGGDAAWVSSQFGGSLNAQIGSYETYDDGLFGVKSFFSLSLLQRDHARSIELQEAIGSIQQIEDSLPYASHKQVRSNIPVNVYNIIADFGQSRGTNTATILPNENHLARQYGRTILIRGNILRNPALFEIAQTSFEAAIDPTQRADLKLEGNFYRTLWHEIGHYLGVDRTADGRTLGAALQDNADLLEEMKADLVSLFAARSLHERGIHSDERLRAIYAGGVLRVLQKSQPRRDQAYGSMQLIQWNWFLKHGLLNFDADGKFLHINYERYPEAVDTLLEVVLELQNAGDADKANAFIEHWTAWDEELHGVIAAQMRAEERYRFRLVTYEALGDTP